MRSLRLGQMRASAIFASVVALCLLTATYTRAMPFSDRVTLPSGEQIFVAGFNLAWINFADDVGATPLDTARFRSAMQAVADSGGNTMRVWLSTNGSNDPVFGADGLVSGLGSKTISNVQQMLSIAKDNHMLLVLTLLTHNFLQNQSGVNLADNMKLLSTDTGLQAYISHAVVPLVTAIGKDPNLLCWEVANEPEGMVAGTGWTDERITQADVQKFTNRIAGAIHRAVPGVLVSTGTVVASDLGWYTDAALKAAGGDSDGTLDFYMAHYYGWNGVSNSPFDQGVGVWSVDKPLVIGEFASSSWGPHTASSSPMQDSEVVDTLLENLYNNGYAGGLFWQYQPDAGDPWMKGFVTASPSLAIFARAHAVDVKFDGISDGKLSVVASGTLGGKAVASPLGRVDTGATVTITAIPDTGYDFVGWSGDTTVAATVNPLVIKVTKDRNVLANFQPAAGTNLLKNGDFSTTTDWQFNISTDGTAQGTVSYAAGQADINITTAGTQNWYAQLQQEGFPLQPGATYVVSFDAWANINREVNVGITTSAWSWQSGDSVAVTTAKTNFQTELKTTDTIASGTVGVLQFNVGEVVSTLHIDNVIVALKGTSPILEPVARHAGAGMRLSASQGVLDWNFASPLSAPTLLVVLDLQGREMGQAIFPAGKTRGTLNLGLPRGLFIARLQGGGHELFLSQ